MRHLKSGRALGVKPAHRRAMLRNLVTSLLEHQQVRTTQARAKEMRRPLDNMITLGKRGDLSARRKALAFVKSKLAMANLFGDFAERYQERPGGFARIVPLGQRRGDGALMVLVILVGSPNDPFAEESQPKRRRRRKVAEDVAREVAAPKTESPADSAEESSVEAVEAASIQDSVAAAEGSEEASPPQEEGQTAAADSAADPSAEQDSEKPAEESPEKT